MHESVRAPDIKICKKLDDLYKCLETYVKKKKQKYILFVHAFIFCCKHKKEIQIPNHFALTNTIIKETLIGLYQYQTQIQWSVS